jgi:hypothetical protein
MFQPPIPEFQPWFQVVADQATQMVDGWWMIHNQPTIILILLSGAKLLHMIDTLFVETHAFLKNIYLFLHHFPPCIWCVGSNSSKWLLKQHLDF